MASVLDLHSVRTKHFNNALEWIVACHIGKCPYRGTQTVLRDCWPRLAAGWQTEV